ncbi:MFS transporter [Shewanella sp. GXUN23E]|uniref:MFS transporter n=1 Tax=Shewanella sp. GXUN23E TaxID=3422498 RepID=UPI003D7E1C12
MGQLMRMYRQQGLLLLLTCLYIQMFTGRQILSVMIEPVKSEFAATDAQMGIVTGLAFALVFALLCLPAGRLVDRVNRTRLLAVCALIWALATWLGATVQTLGALIALRMLIAFAEVPVASASISLISDVYPVSRRAFAISIFSSAATFSAILALSLGAYVVNQLGWRDSFMLVALPALPLALMLWLTAEPATHHEHRTSQTANGQLALSLRQSLRLVWQDNRVRLLILACALGTMGSNAYAMWNTSFLVRHHDMTLQNAGLLAGIVGGGASASGMLFSGWLADRHYGRPGPLRLAIIGNLLGFSALIIYLLFPAEYFVRLADIRLPLAMLACAIAGFFSVFWVGPCMSVLTQMVSPQTRGVAVSLQTLLVTLLGFGVGPVIAGALSDKLTPVFADDALSVAIIVTNISVLIATLMLWWLQRRYLDVSSPGQEQEKVDELTDTAGDCARQI